MRVVLGDGTHTRESAQFSSLFITIDFCRVCISLRKFFIAPLFSIINLRVVWAVHWLHCKFMSFAGIYSKQIIFKFFPVAGFFVKFFFSYVGYIYSLVSNGFA